VPVERAGDRVKLRRGLTFLGMTLVLPGSAQLAAGNKTLGRIALRIWAVLWALIALSVLLALVWRRLAITIFTADPVLRVVQVLLIVVGIGWALLLVDAWRLSRPPELARRHRLGFALAHVVLIAVVCGALFASASIVSSQRTLIAAVFGGGGETTAQAGRINVLLLGGDAGKNRVGLRPDSLTVASIDAETGRTVLFSLPRNLEDVPFPEYSPMHKEFPEGFGCEDHSCMLNAVYTYATEHKSLYPHVKDPGVQATKEAVEGATGLKINYYAMVDLKGFEALIDAVGGITLDVNKRVPIGGGSSRIFGWIEKGEDQHLDGYHALWFARSREGSSDYERMARQKCVMNAMLNQLEPVTVLTKFNDIAKAGEEIVASDVPTSEIDKLMDLALKAKERPVGSVSFVPPLIHSGNPDYGLIHQTVANRIAVAENADLPKDQRTPVPTQPKPKSTKSGSSKSDDDKSDSKKAQTDDLTAICSAD
jgi:LCP family protein required for cell wall assembly